MLLGIIQACRWFGQRLEMKLSGEARRWDYETNTKIAKELQTRVDELGDAMGMEVGITDACVNVAACALMIAHNHEAGKGKGREKPPEPVVEEPPVNKGRFGKIKK